MGFVIHGIPAVRRKVDRHTTIVRNREAIEQLLQIGPVVLTMPMGNCDRLSAVFPAFLIGLSLGSKHRHGRPIVVKLV